MSIDNRRCYVCAWEVPSHADEPALPLFIHITKEHPDVMAGAMAMLRQLVKEGGL